MDFGYILTDIKNIKKVAEKILEEYEDNVPTKPLTLNEKGLFLLKDSGFISIFETCKDQLVKRVREKWDPETKYDVQERSRQFMYFHSIDDKSPFVVLKTYAYNNSKDYSKILRAGALLLRDYYLEKHPEIKD